MIPFKGQSIVYAPLKRLAFIANRAVLSLIGGLQQGLPRSNATASVKHATEFIESTGVLAPDPPLRPQPISLEYKPACAVLFLTNRCNLRCTYCYADGGSLSPLDMPRERAIDAIDVVHRNAVSRGLSRFELGFHGGGEPTLNWPVLRAAVDYARRQRLAAVITMSSNGCYSRDALAFVLDHFDGISLSFDGPPEVQNAQRPMASGKPSFGSVMRTIDAMERRGFSYGIRVTAARPTLEQLPFVIDFLTSHTGAREIQVEPAFPRGRGELNAITPRYASSFIRHFTEAFDAAAARNVRLSYSGARLDVITQRFCASAGEALVLLQTGDVSACFEVHSRNHPLATNLIIGRLSHGEVAINRRRWRLIAGRTADRIAFCRDCFCRYHCAGDCLAKTFSSDRAGHFRPSPRCAINRELTKRLLVRKIADGHGIWMGNLMGEREWV